MLIHHLLGDRRVWAAYVAITHDPAEDAGSVNAAFDVDVDLAYEWYLDQIGGVGGEPARIEIPLVRAASLRIDDLGEDGVTYAIVSGTRTVELGEISGHFTLPLFGVSGALRLAEVCGTPAGSSNWHRAMASALVIGGSWSGAPTPNDIDAVAHMWSGTTMPTTPEGCMMLAGLWAERATWGSEAITPEGDFFGPNTSRADLSPSQRIVATGLDWGT